MDDFQSPTSNPGSSSGMTARTSGPSGSQTANEDEISDNQDDDSSSSSSVHTSHEHDLDNFRLQWRQELESSPVQSNNPIFRDDNTQENDILKQAKKFFWKGVQEERTGRLYEAISSYKRAMQLVPDIELQFSENHGISTENSSDCESDEDGDKEMSDGCMENYDGEDDNDDMTDLITHIEKVMLKSGSLSTCRPSREQKMTHLSALPTEVFIYILKWIVSSDLDLHSLDLISRVCRGFYLCTKDSEIWRLACLRVWGVNCGLPNKYGSWRSMFLTRPHLWFNGVYISKTTYVRFGESSFQDSNYKPCYVVEYFRYLRFFPDGLVLMLTTPDDPYQSLAKLRQRKSPHAAVLRGHFRLVGSNVTAIMKRPQGRSSLAYNNNRRNRRPPFQQSDIGEESYHLELDIQPVKKKPHCKLLWCHYSLHTIHRNCQETVSAYDLTPANFPPFWFSRVRSFTDDLPL